MKCNSKVCIVKVYKYSLLMAITTFPICTWADNEVSKECKEYLNIPYDKYSSTTVSIDNLVKDMGSYQPNADRDLLEKISQPYYLRTFIWENDALANGDTTDEHYTNGMKWSWLYNPCRHKGKLQRKAISYFLEENDHLIHTGVSFGMNMYTPGNITSLVRNTNDRPFVGWVYYSLNALALKRGGHGKTSSAHSLEVQFGVTGPMSGQGRIQTWWHDDVGTSDNSPAGWVNQTEDRFNFNLLWSSKVNYYFGNNRWRVTPNVGVSLGSVSNFLSIGGLVSFGNPNDDFPTSTIQPSFLGDQKKDTFYAFLGVEARYMADSIFVEGYGDVKHNIELENLVTDTMMGFSWKPNKWDTKISFMIINRSKEFGSPDDSLERDHDIGQISFMTTF